MDMDATKENGHNLRKEKSGKKSEIKLGILFIVPDLVNKFALEKLLLSSRNQKWDERSNGHE